MSASLSSLSAEQSRRWSSLQASGVGQGGPTQSTPGPTSAGMQANLFEQILSLPLPFVSENTSVDDFASNPQTGSTSADSEIDSDEQSEPLREEASEEDRNADPAVSFVIVDSHSTSVSADDVTEPAHVEAKPSTNDDSSPDENTATDLLADQPANKSRDESTVDDLKSSVQVAVGNDDSLTSESSLPHQVDDHPQGQSTTLPEVDYEEAGLQPATEGLQKHEISHEDPIAPASNLDEQEPSKASRETRQADSEANAVVVDNQSEHDEDQREAPQRRQRWFEQDPSERKPAVDATTAQGEVRERAAQAPQAAEPSTSVLNSDITPDRSDIAASDLPSRDAITELELTALPAVTAAGAVNKSMTNTNQDSSSMPNDSPLSPNSGSTQATRRGRNSPSAQQAKPGQDSIELTQQERVRLVQRVARSFARLGPEGGQINLRLHPPQLGSLSVQVRLEGRSMTANLVAESNAAREAIVESLPILRSRLAEQGFDISQFQVEVAANGADAGFGGDAGEQLYQRESDGNSQTGSAYHVRETSEASEESRADAANLQDLVWQTHAGIDLHA